MEKENKAQTRPEGWTKITVETEGEAPDVVETGSYFVAAIAEQKDPKEAPIFIVRAVECSTAKLTLLYATIKAFEAEIEKLNPIVKEIFEKISVDMPDYFKVKEKSEGVQGDD